MKLPNGFGQVYKLKGNRRRPWIARKTAGWTEDARQICYTVGYYETRQKALTALTEYNKNPIAERGDISLDALYEEWSAGKYEKITRSTKQNYEAAWKHLASLKDMPVKDIKKSHIQKIVDRIQKTMSYSSAHKIKVLIKMLLDYAMADDIINKNPADLVELSRIEKESKQPFSDLEIKALEKLAPEDEWANTILILIYTGMRISELLGLTKFGVDLDKRVLTGGIKTDAGRDRVIPIHPKILPYIAQWSAKGTDYLITRKGKKVLPNYYRTELYYPVLEKAGIRKLTPHACRHTFGTLIAKSGAKTKSIQEIIGHANYSTTADIYTHIDIEELRKAIELM